MKKNINIENIELYSFDIFDTLITRKTIIPAGIFALIQKEINTNKQYESLSKDIKVNFLNYRKYTEYRCSQKAGLYLNEFQETDLDKIYNNFKDNYLISDEMAEKLKALEIKTEYDNSVGIKENIDKIKFLLKNNKRVVLISDMYLSSDIIRKMLLKADEIFKDIPIYVSSETGFRKQTGLMYEYVKQAEKTEYKNWYHTGDNPLADAGSAIKYGINVELYTKSGIRDYETYTITKHPENVTAQLLLGHSRIARINGIDNSNYKLGAGYIGVFLFPFLTWLLDKAVKIGIKRLYFVLRDTYSIKQACDVIIKQKGLDIKTEYVYGSRKCWRAPSLTIENKPLFKQYLDKAFDDYSMLSFFSNMKKKDIKDFLPDKYKNLYGRKLRIKKQEIIKELSLNDEFLKKITERNKETRELAIKYLKQTIDTTDDNFAFVDLDGTGHSANNLAGLMQDFYADKPIKYFFLFSPLKVNEQINTKINYYYGLNNKNNNAGPIIEAILRPNFGCTKSYEEKNGKYIPVFDCDIQKSDEPFNKDCLKGILDVTELLCKCEKDNPDLCFEDSVIYENYLQYIATDMDRSFARTIGEIEFQYWGLKHGKIGKKYNIFELLKLMFTKNPKTSGEILISKLRSNYIARLIMEMKLYICTDKNERKKRIRNQKYIKSGIPFDYIQNKIINDNQPPIKSVGGGIIMYGKRLQVA